MAKKKPRGAKKTRTRQHVLSDLAVNHVERQILLCGFSIERTEHDYGIDLVMFTYSDSGEIARFRDQVQAQITGRIRHYV